MTENGRSVTYAQDLHDVVADILYAQFSGGPRSGPGPRRALDPSPAGRGSVPFGAFAREAREAARVVRASA
jgi:hypothetical protein